MTRRAIETGDEIRPLLERITEALDQVPYPFATGVAVGEESSGSGTVGALLGSVSIPRDPSQLYGCGMEVLSWIRAMEGRVVSSLVHATEEIELALGLPRSPEPRGHEPTNPSR